MRELKFNNKFAYFLILATLMLLVLVLSSFNMNIAYADNTCEVVFPNEDYIQSSSPQLIDANDKYLIVYDNECSSIFARDLSNNQDTIYPLEFSKVNSICLINSKVFIDADNKYHSLDLKNLSSPKEITLDQTLTFISIKSDGYNLYAKTLSGKLNIYNEEFNLVNSINSEYQYLFAGKSIFTSKDNLIYSFIFNEGTPALNVFNLNNDLYQEYTISEIVQNADLGTDIFVIVDNKIKILSIKDGSTILSTDIEATKYCVHNNDLYIINQNAIDIYKYDNVNESISLNYSISMAGSDNNHLNRPTSIIESNSSLIVSDYNNSRIAIITNQEMESIILPLKPTQICNNNVATYALCESNTIYKIQDNQIVQSYSISNCISITYLDKLYALTNDGIYTLIGGKFVKFTSLDNCNLISSNKEGTNIYAISNDTLYVVSKNGKIINTIPFDFSNVKYLNIDYEGNLYLLKNNQIITLKNELNNLSVSTTYSPVIDVKTSINSFYLNGENIFFTCDECLILKDSFSSTTKSSFISKNIDLTNQSFKYAKLKNNKSICFDKDANADSIMLNDENIILVLSKSYNSQYTYASSTIGTILIDINDYQMIEEETDTNEYIVTKSEYIYSSLIEKQIGTINVNETIQAIAKIEIDGIVYIKFNKDGDKYIPLNSLEIIIKEEAIEDKTSTARIQTKKIGTTINVYEISSLESNIVLSLSDGKKIEILGEDGDFYYISYNNQNGYVLKSDVKLSGLTQIQTIAIVLSVIVFVAGFIIFISISIYKKKNE